MAAGTARWTLLDIVMPLLAVIACLWVARQPDLEGYGVLALTTLAGTLLYLIARRRPRAAEHWAS